MTISQNKKVSVVVPNYNYARYIGKRLESIVRQTYPIYELIVLDDYSTDDSVKKIRQKVAEIKRRYPLLKVKIVENKANSGKVIAQWKKGFELAKGDFVWIAEADDLCSRRFLEEAMKGFDNPDVVLSYTESMIINGSGFIIAPDFRWSRDKEKTGHYKKSYVKDGRQEIEEILAVRCTIPNVSGVVFRKDEKILRYLSEAMKFKQVGDWYLYVKILENGKIAYNRKSLNKFRVHSGSVTGKARGGREHYTEIMGMYEMLMRRYDLDERIKRYMDKEAKRIRTKYDIME